jgi:hypothetical protein
MADAVAPNPPKERIFILLVIGEFVALGLAAWAMFRFDLGWIGAVIIAAIVAVFTIAIVRTGEKGAAERGCGSTAMTRYNRRMLIVSGLYVAGLMGAVWAHDAFSPSGPLAYMIAFAPSVGVLAMVWAMARLLIEESDEYLRYRTIRSYLFGLATLLTLATVWGFFEQFGLVPHVPSWAAVPVFAIGMGLSSCITWGRP